MEALIQRRRYLAWLRRNRVLAFSAAAVALALLAGSGVALWQAREARLQAQVAAAEAANAEREAANARATLAVLTETLADPAAAAAMGRAGRERAEREFSWGAIAAETEALYRSLV